MTVVLSGCPQPPRVDGEVRQCLRDDYCFCRVCANAKRRCVARGEGWMWGLTVKGSDE